MARVPYVEYNPDIAALFDLLNLHLDTASYGGIDGWDKAAFNANIGLAREYLDTHMEEYDEDLLEGYYELLEADWTTHYWSMEGPG